MDFSACFIALGCTLVGAYIVGAYQVAKVLRFIFRLPTFLHYRKTLAAESGRFGKLCHWATYIAVGWGWNLSWCGAIFTKHIFLGRGDLISRVFARQLFASIASRTVITSLEVLDMVLTDLKKVEGRFPHLEGPETSSPT